MSIATYTAAYRSKYPDASDEEIKRGYIELYSNDYAGALGSGIEAGVRGLLGGIGSLGDLVGLDTRGYAQENFDAATALSEPYRQMGSVYDNPEVLLNPAYLLHQTGQALPSVAASIGPGAVVRGAALAGGLSQGAAGLLGAGASGLSGGLQEAGSDYYQHGDAGRALLFGAASAGLNALPVGQLFNTSKSLLARVGGGAALEGVTEYAEEPINALIHGESITDALKQGLDVVPGAVLSSLLIGGGGIAANRGVRKALGKAQTQETLSPQEAMYSQVDTELANEENKFHSPLMQAVSAQTTNSASGEQWLNTLTRDENGSRVPKIAGLSKEELDWYDIPGFLSQQKGPVSKQAILDYIGSQEVGLETKQVAPDNVIKNYFTPGGTQNVSTLINATMNKGFQVITPQSSKTFATRAEAVKVAADLRLEFPELASKIQVAPMQQKTGYKPHAFDEGDIWTRTSQRVNAEGRPVTLVEEVQSDLHQAANKKYDIHPWDAVNIIALKEGLNANDVIERYGYANRDDYVRLAINMLDDVDFFQKLNSGWFNNKEIIDSGGSGEKLAEWNRLAHENIRNLIDAAREKRSKKNAPFSKSWPALAVKTEIQNAIAKGQTEIYITPGKMQQSRYDNAGKSEKLVDFYDKEIVRDMNRFLKKYNAKLDTAVLPDAQVRQTPDGKWAVAVNSIGGEATGYDSAENAATFWRIKITPELKNAGSLPLWSRNERAAGRSGASVDALNAHYKKTFGTAYTKLLETGRVKIVENTKALPGNHPATVAGMYDPKTDTTYIVASNTNVEDATGKLLHEVGVHAGMEQMLGQQLYKQVLTQVQNLRASSKVVQQAYDKAQRLSADPTHIQHEAIAYLVENHPQMTLVQRIVAAVRQFLFRLGVKINLSAADIREMAAASLRAYARTPQTQAQTQAAPQYSQFEDTAKNEGFDAAIKEARRQPGTGVLPDADVEELASVLGTTKQDIINRLAGETYNAEEMTAAIRQFRQWVDTIKPRMAELAKGVKEGTLSVEQFNEAAEIFLKAASKDGIPIASTLDASAAEAARLMRRLREQKDSMEQARSLLDAVGEGNAELAKAKILAFADLLSANPNKAVAEATKSYKATGWNKWAEYYTASLLSSVQTQLVNVVSTAAHTIVGNLDNYVAAAIGKLRQAFKPGEAPMSFAEATAQLKAQVASMGIARKVAWDYVKHFEDPNKVLKFEEFADKPRRAIGADVDSSKTAKALGAIIRLPFRGMGGADIFFKQVVYSGSLARQAYLASTQDGQTFEHHLKNPTEDMKTQAKFDAARGTFNEPLGKFGNFLISLRKDHPVIGTILFPFITTPTNIIKEVFRHSALAVFMKDVRADFRKGGRTRDMVIGRMAVGSVFSATAYTLAMTGMIVGQPPEDPNERRLWYAQGKKPNSIKIGDTWYSFSRIEPLGMLLGIAADAATFNKHMDIDEAGKLWSMVAGSVAKNLTSKTYLRSLSEVLNMISEPERYGEKYIQNFMGSLLVPTGVSHVARAFDDRLRVAESLLDAVKARVPVLRNTLTEKLDLFGRPITDTAGPVSEFLSPVATSTAVDDKLVSELRRLDINVQVQGRKFRGVELSATDRNQMIRQTNAPVYAVLQRVILSPSYQRMADPVKKYILEKVVDAIRTQGRYVWSRQHPQILREAQQRQQQFRGVPDYE